MSAFTEPLRYESTSLFFQGRRVYRILNGFTAVDPETGFKAPIQPGFLTDLGSFPALARVRYSPDAAYAQPFVVHDKLYRMRFALKGDEVAGRKFADEMLYRLLATPFKVYDRHGNMSRVTCSEFDRAMIYSAVRLFGRYGESLPLKFDFKGI